MKRTGFTLGDPPPDTRFYSIVQTGDAASAVQEICCEIRALHIEQLTGALDAVLRSVTAYAALNEAVLETRAVRLADPSLTSTALAEGLARQLSRAGLGISFGSSWTPAPFADASVGIQGLQEDFRSFLRPPPEGRPPCR